MPIVIKLTEELDASYALVELQGDLKSHDDKPQQSQFVGDLHFTTSGTPLLIIGHHLLYGKEMALEQPLALLRRETRDNTEFIVQAIVRKKIIFKTRPKPIVGFKTP